MQEEETWTCQHGTMRKGYAKPTASCHLRAMSPCNWTRAEGDAGTPEVELSPGTRVRLIKGPMGAVIFDQPHRFVDQTFSAGYETDVSDVPCATEGWVYLNTEDDRVVIPVHPSSVERI